MTLIENGVPLSKQDEDNVTDDVQKGLLPIASLIHSPVSFLSKEELESMEESEL